MRSSSDVVVVGGGLVGLATAHALATANADLRIAVLEAESGVARHQSGRNSGVLHSGVYYKPGSQKSALCVEGADQMVQFCTEHAIDIERTGKVIIATSASELDTLRELESRGRSNGLVGLELLDEQGLREYEPAATGVMAHGKRTDERCLQKPPRPEQAFLSKGALKAPQNGAGLQIKSGYQPGNRADVEPTCGQADS